MRALILTWARALAATWPTVLGWYLGGAVVREAVLSVAAPLGPGSPLAAFLLLPLARLVSYVGMFLAVRRALPESRALAGEPVRRPFREFADVLIASIVPFFALYGLVGLLQEDLEVYASRAQRYSFGFGLRFLDPGSGPVVVAVIVVALAGRLLLQRFGDRLPRGLVLLELYLEAVWVFVAVRGIAASLGGAYTWIRERQVVRWWLDAKQALRGLADPIRTAIDGVDGLVPLLLQVVALPLAWLLVAGIVHTRGLAAVAEERVVPRRVEARLRALLGRLPDGVRRRRGLVTDEWDTVYRPLSVAARLAARTEPGALGLFLAASAVLYAVTQWAVFAITRAIGPQEVGWWLIAYPIVFLVVTAVVETVRICLLSAVFDRALAAWRGRHGTVTPSAPAAAAARPADALPRAP